jgi:hypothetical protein
MRKARRTGRGVRLEEWHVPADDATSAGDYVLSWCREVVANCRRPFGIDHFDLAVACRPAADSSVQTERFLSLRPADLYSGRVATKLGLLLQNARRTSGDMIIAAAVFSWGEAAHHSLPVRP